MTKAETMLEALINSQLAGIEIDEEDGFIRFNFTNGFVEIDGEALELYVELDEVN
jgi:hypothetical protein